MRTADHLRIEFVPTPLRRAREMNGRTEQNEKRTEGQEREKNGRTEQNEKRTEGQEREKNGRTEQKQRTGKRSTVNNVTLYRQRVISVLVTAELEVAST
jgi:hypothetical protein